MSHALAHRIKTLRERRGLTQVDLARRAGVSTIYLVKLEAGERGSPSFPVLARLARALRARLVVDLVPRRQDTGRR